MHRTPLKARFFAVLWLAIVVPAAFLLVLHWREWSESLPERALAGENLVLLALIFPIVKLLHELGHGLILKAYGGAAHDAGLMFLIFMPVPYIDASASLSFRSKYRRARRDKVARKARSSPAYGRTPRSSPPRSHRESGVPRNPCGPRQILGARWLTRQRHCLRIRRRRPMCRWATWMRAI